MVFKIIMIAISVVVIASVCLQEGRSDGLSGAIGGGAEQLFGKKRERKTDEILRKVTTACVIAYFIVSVAWLYR